MYTVAVGVIRSSKWLEINDKGQHIIIRHTESCSLFNSIIIFMSFLVYQLNLLVFKNDFVLKKVAVTNF